MLGHPHEEIAVWEQIATAFSKSRERRYLFSLEDGKLVYRALVLQSLRAIGGAGLLCEPDSVLLCPIKHGQRDDELVIVTDKHHVARCPFFLFAQFFRRELHFKKSVARITCPPLWNLPTGRAGPESRRGTTGAPRKSNRGTA